MTKPGIRKGQRARGERVATMIAVAVSQNWATWEITMARIELARCLVLQLQALRIRARDLDVPNGAAALEAIARTIVWRERHVFDRGREISGSWTWIVHRAAEQLQNPRCLVRARRRLAAAGYALPS